MADRKIADLIKDIRGDAQLLINDQVELAKAELTPAAKNAGIGGGLFGRPATSASTPRPSSTSPPPSAWPRSVSPTGPRS